MRLPTVLLIAFVAIATTAVSATSALERTQGAVGLELRSGRGRAVVKSQGFFFGRVRRGRIVATENVTLRNCNRREKSESTGLVTCRGRHLRFLTAKSPWKVVLRGRGINASGVVRGCLVLDGADSGDTGEYKIGDENEFKPWPRTRWQHVLGPGKC